MKDGHGPGAGRCPGVPALRVGILQGERIVEERLLRGAGPVTVGQGPRCTFVISSASLPRRFLLFDRGRGPDAPPALRFTAAMTGRVVLEGRPWALEELRRSGRAKREGGLFVLELPGEARGKVDLGEVTILFQRVRLPASQPAPRLPLRYRGRLLEGRDLPMALSLGVAALVAGGFFLVGALSPAPAAVKRSRRFEQVKRSGVLPAVASAERPRIERPWGRRAVLESLYRDRRGAGPGSAIRPGSRPGRHDSGRRRPAARRAAGGEERLSAKEKRKLLTLFALNGSTDQLARIAISGRCTEPGGCPDGERGPDPLARGLPTGSLDRAAEQASRMRGAAPGGAGPASGLGARSGLSGPGADPVVMGPTGIGPGGGVAGMRPRAVRRLHGPRTQFVPPPGRPGASGALLARLRNLVLRLRHCYERALVHDARLRGSARIHLSVLPSGRVSGVSVATDLGAAVASCLRSRIAAWYLGTQPQAVFYGPFTVRFHPGG